MPEAGPKLYLVDAMSNIHRAYHAIQRLSTSAGKPTNAIYGFVTMLRKMLREHTPDYLAVAWDGPERTVRHEDYAEYKANRAGRWPTTWPSQIPDIRRILEAYRIPILELPGYEADDVIGTLSKKAAALGFDVVIVTADKDMLQLVGPARPRVSHGPGEVPGRGRRVGSSSAWRPARSSTSWRSWATAWTTSPACPRVGEVTAKKWISEYGDLDDPAREGRRDQGQGRREPARAHARTRCSRGAWPRSRRTCRSPSSRTRSSARRPTREKLKDLFVELEFHSLAAEIQREAAAAPEISSGRASGRASRSRSGPAGPSASRC